MQWFTDINNIWVVPFYPLLAFFLIVLGRAFLKDGFPKPLSMALTVLATFLGLLHSFGAIGWLLGAGAHDGHGAAAVIERNWTWLVAGDFRLSVGTLLDAMSVMMLFVVTFISMLIQIYTHGYMKHDPGYAKFFAYLALFNFSMLGLVLSTNLFQIYIFWELVGVSSYLLIGFWFTRPSAAAAAVKAFLMNRVGDFGFLFGILGLLYFSFPAWSGYLAAHPEQAFLSFQALGDPAILDPVLAGAGVSLFAVICFLLFMGPMAKSAQVPLHTWLPDAMEGPTPISALIHAATMVAAGVYLIGRVYPVFTASEAAMAVVAGIGLITAIIAATIALTQYDIKKALAYSTMSQLGFMVTAMGVGAFTAGLFHLFTHAFFKAMLFLCSGSVIHACEDEQDMRKMGGLLKKLPATGWTYLIGTMAISGVLWTSGFWSKDAILIGAEEYPVIYWGLAITAGLTSFYMFRTFFLTFTGAYRGEAHVHHEDPVLTVPLMVLAIPSALIGVAMAGLSDIHWLPAFGDYIAYGEAHHEAHSFMQAVTSQVGLTSLVVGLGGLALAWWLYGTAGGAALAEKVRTGPVTSSLYRLFANKWYFDEMYRNFVDKVYLSFANASAGFDRGGIDGAVNWTGRTVVGSGYLLRQLQSGKVQVYIAVMFFAVVVLSLVLFYGLL